MNLFIQGMRRSGTTILYDALLEDPALDCHYEPLREEGETVGGGSGARETDAFARTRELRREFRDRHYPDLELDEFNWGGPRMPDLELEPGLPAHCDAFLRYLLDRTPNTMIKETRLYCKVPALARLDPESAFVHVVRDPRAVTASIVLGRGHRQLRKGRIADEEAFFAYRSDRKLWSSRRLSELLTGKPGFDGAGEDPPDYVRVLMVWKHTFTATFEDATRAFGERYLLLRNEDLRADPEGALALVYDALGRELPPEVASWARGHVREVEAPFAGGDARWGEAFTKLDLEGALSTAGYGELMPAAPA